MVDIANVCRLHPGESDLYGCLGCFRDGTYAELTRLREENARLREALEFYAKAQWPHRRNGEAYTPLTLDCGQKARAALAAGGEE